MANVIDIILRGKNEASTAIRQVKGDLTGLDDAATNATGGLSALGKAIPVAAITTAALKIGEMAVELGSLGAQSIVTRDSFESVMASVGKSPALLNELSSAAGGTITQMRLMQLANTAVAGASEELGGAFAEALPKLIEGARAANQLNPALGDTEFLFNSLVTGIKRGSPMLIDNTGITLKLGDANEAFAKSLGKSVNELTEEEKKLAILQGTLDGVDRLVQQAGGNLDNLTTSTQQLTTAWQDLRTAIGEGLAPMVSQTQAGMADALSRITAAIQAGSVDSEIALQGLNSQLQIAKDELAQLEAQPFDPSDEFGTAAARTAELRGRIDDLYDALAKLTPANEAAAASSGVAAVRMADSINDVEGAVDDLHSTLGETTHWDKFVALGQAAANKVKSEMLIARAAGMGLLEPETTTPEPSKTRWGLYTDYARKVAGATRSQSDIDKLITDWKDKISDANTDTAEDFSSKYTSAINDLSSDIESALSKGISNAKGLLDLTGAGGGDLFAPGANGPFENIYRALDVAKLGAASPWAQALGLTQEDAKRISADFQRGLFTEEVQGLINVDQLLGQIQGEQDAAASGAKFAQMLAGRLGVKDAGALVASQTFQAIAGGIDADPTQQQDAAQRVLDAYLNNVGGVVNGKDYAERMVAYGGVSWEYYENGLLEGAKASTVFARAVDAAIGAWMARQAAPKSQGVVGAAAAMGVTP